MRNCRLLAIDIDGTLVNSREELTPATRDALVRAGRSGIHVVLATGRRYSRTLHLVEPLAISVPLVTAGGALVKDHRDHRTLYCAEFAPDVLERTLSLVAGAGFDPVVCCDTYREGFDYYVGRETTPGEELSEYLRLNPGSGRVWPELVSRPPAGVFSAFAMGTRSEMLALDDLLQASLGQRLSTHVLRSPKYAGFFCEISPHRVTKWSAIQRLAAGWGIADAEICAVGDDVNDIPMIRAAGLGVAMGNALAEVKAAADRIAPSQENDGLVDVVGWLLDARG